MVLVRSDATYIYSQYTLIGLTDRLGRSSFSFQFQYTKASIGLEYISQFRQNVWDPDISNHSENFGFKGLAAIWSHYIWFTSMGSLTKYLYFILLVLFGHNAWFTTFRLTFANASKAYDFVKRHLIFQSDFKKVFVILQESLPIFCLSSFSRLL